MARKLTPGYIIGGNGTAERNPGEYVTYADDAVFGTGRRYVAIALQTRVLQPDDIARITRNARAILRDGYMLPPRARLAWQIDRHDTIGRTGRKPRPGFVVHVWEA